MPSLCDFIVEMWRLDGPRSEMHLGDVFVTLYFDASGDLGSSALWFDEPSRLVGAAFFTGATFDMVVRPEAASSPLAVDMIDWAMAEAKRRDPNATSIRVQRRPSLPQRVAFLEQLGFARMDSGALAFTRTLNGLLPEPSLPDGFVCRPLVAQDVPSWIRAFNDAFPGAGKSTGDYERLMRCSGYDGAFALVVVDREDEVVAIASVWLDRDNGVGLFEPVGTRTGYRRLGLARAAMAANLRRLAQRGASSAVVRVRNANVAARACYESLGFTIASDDFGFERSLGERLLAGMDKR